MEFVDENLIERYTAQWSEYVNEHDGNVLITLHFYKEMNLTTQKLTYYLDARAGDPVKSIIDITGVLYRKDAFPLPSYWVPFAISIPVGSDSATFSHEVVGTEEFDRDAIVGGINPTSDATYNYSYTIVYYKPGMELPPGFTMPPIYATT